MNDNWTHKRTAALMAFWNEGLSTTEIGLRLGVTKNAVIGKVNRMGLPQRRPQSKQDELGAAVHALARLSDDTCHWPLGEPGKPDFRFYGELIRPGKPYYEQHCRSAYVPPTTNRLKAIERAAERAVRAK